MNTNDEMKSPAGGELPENEHRTDAKPAGTLDAWSENAGREPRSPEDAADGPFELRRPEGEPTPENMHGAENRKDGNRGGGDGRSYENHASVRS